MRASALTVPLGGLPRLPRIGRQARRAALAALLVMALLGGFWLWFRDSSFAAVERVRVSGVSGPGAAQIEAALRRSARGMSTLDFSSGALRGAVASWPEVRTLSVTTSFPHEMRISVSEQLPAAVLQAPSGAREAVAGDGALLGSPAAAVGSASLPALAVGALPRGRVREAQTLEYLAVLGAAPAPLLSLVGGAQSTAKGLTVTMRDGLPVYFGDATHARTKWLAFAAALLAAGATGATYVDVRAPERPAVGAGGQAGATASTGTAGAGAASLGTFGAGNVAALVAGLKATIGGEQSEPLAAESHAGGGGAEGHGEPAPAGEAQAQPEEGAAAGGQGEGSGAQGAPSGTSGGVAPGG
ncbi:MAG: FtsQ-type POTRA domain-containing protein [Acidobacteriota bacterium]|nr:FtsQ-type POTRA domain-containing protein [Acidobacteriota bacterium]